MSYGADCTLLFPLSLDTDCLHLRSLYMANNWAFIIWIGITGFLCNAFGGKHQKLVNRKTEVRTTWFWAIAIFIPIALGAALRTTAEGDTGTYKLMFDSCPSNLSEAISYVFGAERDGGYALWEVVFKSIFGNNFQLFIGVNAFFCAALLVKTYRKFSSSYAISMFLFVAGFEYFQWMYNGMRQFMAVCIALNCMEDIIKKRYKRIIIPFIIAASLHMSVLIIIPCLFFVQGQAFNKRMMLFIAGVVFVGVILGRTGQLNEIIAQLMQSTQYDSVLDEFYMTMDSGTNALRVLVYLVPTILGLIGLRYIRQANDPVINFCTNMSVISAGIYIVSMFTSAIMIGRLPIYFSIYNYILLPWEIDNIFEKHSAKLVTGALVLCYLVYNYYQCVMVYGQSFNLGFLSLGF